MSRLIREDLMSLEEYSENRADIRLQMMALKKIRVISVGPDITMHFENKTLIQYQIQEMLRVEKIFEATGINEELEAYGPMVPDGSNWKATQMIEFPDPEQRKIELALLMGIDRQTWVQVGTHDKVFAISDEDLERENEEKTSSVHFMRFELTGEMVADAKSGAAIHVGMDHPHYDHSVTLSAESHKSFVEDLA